MENTSGNNEIRYLGLTRRQLLTILVWLLIFKIVIIAVGYFCISNYDDDVLYPAKYFEPVSQYKLIDLLCHWDGIHYIMAAKTGYRPDPYAAGPTGRERFAFFPLYPTLIYLVEIIIGDFGFAAVIVANIFSFLAAIEMAKLAKLYGYDPSRVSTALVVYPIFAAFGTFAYTEAIFLFFLLASFRYFKLGFPGRSSLYTFLACMTRSPGVLIGPIYLLLILRSERKKDNGLLSLFGNRLLIFNLLAIILAIGLTFGFFYLKSGNLFIYFDIEKENWNAHMTLPGNYLLYNLKGAIRWRSEVYLTRFLLSIPPLVGTFYWIWKRQWDFAVMATVFLAFYSVQGGGTIQSVYRFCLTIVPMYFLIVPLGNRWRALEKAYPWIGLVFTAFIAWGFFTHRPFM